MIKIINIRKFLPISQRSIADSLDALASKINCLEEAVRQNKGDIMLLSKSDNKISQASFSEHIPITVQKFLSATYLSFEPVSGGVGRALKIKATDSLDNTFFIKVLQTPLLKKKSDLFIKMIAFREKLSYLVNDLKLPVISLLEVDRHQDYIYATYNFISGRSLMKAIKDMDDRERYRIGVKLGKITRHMHDVTTIAPKNKAEIWSYRFDKMVKTVIERYNSCEHRFDGDEMVIDYINSNLHLMDGRPLSFCHLDLHPGNVMITTSEDLYFIDLDAHISTKTTHYDPYYEFKKLMHFKYEPYLTTGYIDGYTKGFMPENFWKLIKLYSYYNCFATLLQSNAKDPRLLKKKHKNITASLEAFSKDVPGWYISDIIKQNKL